MIFRRRRSFIVVLTIHTCSHRLELRGNCVSHGTPRERRRPVQGHFTCFPMSAIVVDEALDGSRPPRGIVAFDVSCTFATGLSKAWQAPNYCGHPTGHALDQRHAETLTFRGHDRDACAVVRAHESIERDLLLDDDPILRRYRIDAIAESRIGALIYCRRTDQVKNWTRRGQVKPCVEDEVVTLVCVEVCDVKDSLAGISGRTECVVIDSERNDCTLDSSGRRRQRCHPARRGRGVHGPACRPADADSAQKVRCGRSFIHDRVEQKAHDIAGNATRQHPGHADHEIDVAPRSQPRNVYCLPTDAPDQLGPRRRRQRNALDFRRIGKSALNDRPAPSDDGQSRDLRARREVSSELDSRVSRTAIPCRERVNQYSPSHTQLGNRPVQRQCSSKQDSVFASAFIRLTSQAT
jgi:hypothetical protein